MAGLRAALDVEAAEQAPQVHLDGVFADLQLFRDVAVGQSSVQHDEQLLLPLGQLLRNGGCVFVFRLFGQELAQHLADLGGTGGFFDVGIGTRFPGQVFVVGSWRGGQHDQRSVGQHLAHFAHTGDAVGVGQLQVETDQLRLPVFSDRLTHGGQSLQFNHLGGRPKTTQKHDDCLAHQRMIVNDKDTHGRMCCLSFVFRVTAYRHWPLLAIAKSALLHTLFLVFDARVP
ncbi:hypothetical protein FQZ97_882210 [compost metagenome]